ARERRARREAMPAGERPQALDFRTSELHRSSYLSISRAQGRFLYSAARAIGARHIVEFGTSHGISTLYLAAAARETGGRVIGSEFHADKIVRARANLAEAGLGDLVE